MSAVKTQTLNLFLDNIVSDITPSDLRTFVNNVFDSKENLIRIATDSRNLVYIDYPIEKNDLVVINEADNEYERNGLYISLKKDPVYPYDLKMVSSNVETDKILSEGKDNQILATINGELTWIPQSHGYYIKGTIPIEAILNIVPLNLGEVFIASDDNSEVETPGIVGDGYSWDGKQWLNIGQLRGIKGDQGTSGPEGPQGQTNVDAGRGLNKTIISATNYTLGLTNGYYSVPGSTLPGNGTIEHPIPFGAGGYLTSTVQDGKFEYVKPYEYWANSRANEPSGRQQIHPENYDNTTYRIFGSAITDPAGPENYEGLVPLVGSESNKFLRDTGSWSKIEPADILPSDGDSADLEIQLSKYMKFTQNTTLSTNVFISTSETPAFPDHLTRKGYVDDGLDNLLPNVTPGGIDVGKVLTVLNDTPQYTWILPAAVLTGDQLDISGLIEGDTTLDTLQVNGDLTITGNLNLPGIPSADPLVAGRVWSNLGILTVSAG